MEKTLNTSPVRVPKVAAVLGGMLREKIVLGKFDEDMPLPNERDLGRQAVHRTDEDLAELRRCHAQLERVSALSDIASYVRANLDWHVQVVQASHNERPIAVISSMSKAIEARDPGGTARRMDRHVTAYVNDALRSRSPRKDLT